MAVERFRDVRDMPPVPRPAAGELVSAIAAAWERAHVRCGPDIPRGVSRFRSLEAAQQARLAADRARVNRLRGPGPIVATGK